MDKEQSEALRDALLEAFPEPYMLQEILGGKNVERWGIVHGSTSIPHDVLAVLRFLERVGGLKIAIRRALERRPGHRRLLEVVRRYWPDLDLLAPSPESSKGYEDNLFPWFPDILLGGEDPYPASGSFDPGLEASDPMCGSVEPRAPADDACAPEPRPVHWNTRVLDGERALDELFVTVGRAYTIETGLDPVQLPGALASTTIAPGGLPDGTKVTFEVSCPQAILRGHEDPAGAPAARVAHTVVYDVVTGRCPPARFGLVPAARGRIPLTLSVVTDNAVRASTLLTLQAAATGLGVAGLAPGVAAVAAVPTPPIEQEAPPSPPPSLEVSAAALTGPGAQLRLQLTETDQLVISDGVVNEKPRDPAVPPRVLSGAAIRARAKLVELSRAYRRPAGATSPFALADAPAMCLQMARVGADLHQQFFGLPDDSGTDLDVQRLARAIAGTPASGGEARLQIAAAFQPFPWAVLYDGAYRGKELTDDPSSVDLDCFWGHRFRIDRMIMGHAREARAPIIRPPVRVQPCLNPHLDDDAGAKQLGVKVVELQRALFEGLPGVSARPHIESADGFLAFLASDTACDLLYVFCHATAAKTRDDLFTFSRQAPDTQAKLIFAPPPAPPVDVAAMRKQRRSPLVDRPLVFLNACSTTAGDEAFQAPLLEQFLDRWGASGVLGTDWEVPAVFADAFVRQLLDRFLRERAPLGEALWRTGQDAFAQGNPFPLVYALYGRPDLTITAATAAPLGRAP